MTLDTGQILLQRYRIIELLEQGGMGAVYRAWDTRLQKPVALKEMIPQPGLDLSMLAQLRQQFEREAVTLARLRHNHLVGVTDFFEEHRNAYLVMEFVEGESLAQCIEREGSLSQQQVLSWTRQLLGALAYCHNQGIIHRDVSPQNVIIRPEGDAVLVDFGLVKLWDPRDPRTRTAMRGIGKPEYAPPEQYDDRSGHTDARSDIYSLGATLYHALTGKAPPTVTQRMVDPASLAAPRRLRPDLSACTERAILRAMEPQPFRRFQSAQEMTQALRGKGHPRFERTQTKVWPGGGVGRAGPRPLRQRVPTWAWALGATALLGLAIVVLANLLPKTSTKPVSVSAPTDAPMPPVLPASVGTRVPSTVAMAPRNADELRQLACWTRQPVSQVTYSAERGLLAVASSLGAYLYSTDWLTGLQHLEADAQMSTVAFSPDGSILASGSADSSVQLWGVSDGFLLNTLEGHEGDVLSVAFSPNGSILASGSTDNTIQLWGVSDGFLLNTLRGHEGYVNSVAFSDNGSLLASGSTDNTVRLWAVTDGFLLNTMEGHDADVESVAFSTGEFLLASGSADDTVRLWGVSDGFLLKTMEGHRGDVRSVTFSPDGSLLASGSADGTVRLRDGSDGSLLRTVEGHGSEVNSVSFSPDGHLLASGMRDGTVCVWGVLDE